MKKKSQENILLFLKIYTLDTLKIFSLSLVSKQLDYDVLGYIHVSFAWGLLSSSIWKFIVFITFGKISDFISSNIFSVLSLLSLETLITHVLGYLKLPHSLLIHHSFFFSSLFFSLGFTLISFYCYGFKFTNVFFFDI